MLNAAQWASAARILVMVVGAIAVGRGWATWEQVQAVASNADVLAIIGGGFAIAVPAFYAIKSRSAAGFGKALASLPLAERAKAASAIPASTLIGVTADLPQVAEIQTTPRLADAIPSDKVVPADRR